MHHLSFELVTISLYRLQESVFIPGELHSQVHYSYTVYSMYTYMLLSTQHILQFIRHIHYLDSTEVFAGPLRSKGSTNKTNITKTNRFLNATSTLTGTRWEGERCPISMASLHKPVLSSEAVSLSGVVSAQTARRLPSPPLEPDARRRCGTASPRRSITSQATRHELITFIKSCKSL